MKSQNIARLKLIGVFMIFLLPLATAYLLYYGLSQFEAVRESVFWVVLKDAWWCALIAFVLNTTAYTTEIFRGAIEATPWGEVEAAKAILAEIPVAKSQDPDVLSAHAALELADKAAEAHSQLADLEDRG